LNRRSLTDPRKLSGIGDVYSDEILHRAQLCPIPIATELKPKEIAWLLLAKRESLLE
jgi:formamidopyrimidine-DNA glycosylase